MFIIIISLDIIQADISISLGMFTDSHLREGGTNLGCFPVGRWLTTPTSPPVYGPEYYFPNWIKQLPLTSFLLNLIFLDSFFVFKLCGPEIFQIECL